MILAEHFGICKTGISSLSLTLTCRFCWLGIGFKRMRDSSVQRMCDLFSCPRLCLSRYPFLSKNHRFLLCFRQKGPCLDMICSIPISSSQVVLNCWSLGYPNKTLLFLQNLQNFCNLPCSDAYFSSHESLSCLGCWLRVQGKSLCLCRPPRILMCRVEHLVESWSWNASRGICGYVRIMSWGFRICQNILTEKPKFRSIFFSFFSLKMYCLGINMIRSLLHMSWLYHFSNPQLI